MAGDKQIEVENVSKLYRLGELKRSMQLREVLARGFRRRSTPEQELWALRDVSFGIDRGEVVGIIGRNGAGKSTLLKVLSKITYPTSGRVRVRGRVASLLEVGTGFHEELTGRENVFLNGSILGMTRRQILARFDEIVSFAAVERFIDTPIKRYSSGMRLRLGFAVAAHLDPDVLIVDEVLAVGDAEFQKKCLRAMDDLHTGGRTVLFVSHNMAAIENLCARSLWIDGGRLRMDSETHEVIAAYMASFASAAGEGHDVRNLEGRRGTGEIRFTKFAFLTSEDEPKNVIRSGDSLKIRLSYECHRRAENPHFGVKIHSELGTLITDTSTWATGVSTPMVTPGPGEAEVAIDFLNLMPGRYYVSLWAQSLGRVNYDILDHCATFDVETSNYYKSGRGIEPRFGLIFLPCHWKVVHGDAR